MSRTKLILIAGAICGVSAALALQGVGVRGKGQASSTPQYFALELGGVKCGFLQSVSPGPSGGGGGPMVIPPITMQMGMSMTKAVYDWINASWAKGYTRKNGAIVACNFNYESMSSREFYDALITEVKFPSFDAQSSAPAYLTVQLQPRRWVTKQIRGATVDPSQNRQKTWTCSNFRVKIGGLPCERVTKVDAFTLKQGTAMGLNFHFNSADAPAWQAEMNPSGEKSGTLVFLAPNGKDELGQLSFKLNRVRMVQASNQGPGPDGQPRSIAWTSISDPKLTIAP